MDNLKYRLEIHLYILRKLVTMLFKIIIKKLKIQFILIIIPVWKISNYQNCG